MKTALRTLAFLAVLGGAACITVDSDTGKVIPRGDQKYPFAEVKKHADDLRVGMSKRDVLLLLGSPAEMSERRSVWVYLPERPAILVPGRALRLEFYDGRLKEFGYHAIILGAQL